MKRIITNTIAELDGTIRIETFEEDVSIPREVTNFQARAALIAVGKFELVDSALKASGNPLALQAWEYANNVSRYGPLVLSMASQLGFTEEELDELFYNASFIEA